jgi:hypothetical protein
MRREDIEKPEISLVSFDADTTVLDPTYIRIKVEVCVPSSSSDEYIEELQKAYGEIAINEKIPKPTTEDVKHSLDRTQQSEGDSPRRVKKFPLRFGKEFADTRIHYEWFRKQLGYIAIYDYMQREDKVTEEEKKVMKDKVNLSIALSKALIIFSNEDIEIFNKVENVFIKNYQLLKDECIKDKVDHIKEVIESVVEAVVKEVYNILNMEMESRSFIMRIEEEENSDDEEDNEVTRNREGRFQKWKLDHCMTVQEHDLAEKVLEKVRIESGAKKDAKWIASSRSIQAAILYKKYLESKVKDELYRAIECVEKLVQIYKEENLPDLYAEGVAKLLKLYKKYNLLDKAFELLSDIDFTFSKLSGTAIYFKLYDFLIEYTKSIGANKKVVYYCYRLAEVPKSGKKKKLSYITQALEGLEVNLDIDQLIIKNYKEALRTIKMFEESKYQISANSLGGRRDRSLSIDYISYSDNKDPIIKSNMEEPAWPNLFLTLVDAIFKGGLEDSIHLSLYFLE